MNKQYLIHFIEIFITNQATQAGLKSNKEQLFEANIKYIILLTL